MICNRGAIEIDIIGYREHNVRTHVFAFVLPWLTVPITSPTPPPNGEGMTSTSAIRRPRFMAMPHHHRRQLEGIWVGAWVVDSRGTIFM